MINFDPLRPLIIITEHYSDDKALLLRTATGDPEAFEHLFHAYRNKLYSFILRITGSQDISEDIVQDVFMKIWAGRDKLSAIDNFNAYLFTMARNHCMNLLKRMAHENNIIDQLGQPENSHPQQENRLVEKEILHVLLQAVDQLPPQQKLIFILSKQQGMPLGEIAAQLNLSVSTVKNHSSQALQTLRKSIRSRFPYPGLTEIILVLAVLENYFSN